MSISTLSRNGITCVDLAGNLDIMEAADLKKHLLDITSKATGAIYLDTSRVQSLDGSIVQTLLAWKALLKEKNFELTLDRFSPAWKDCLEVVGVSADLNPR